jgi:Domain of unknown function (DUF4277)
VGALPILNQFIARMGLADEMTMALKNAGYAEALLALVKNILVDRNALYAVGEWTALYDAGLVAQDKIGDDKLGCALDRLFATDRATLQKRVVLAVMKRFDLKMDRIHNDTTSVTVSGAYDGQNPRPFSSSGGHNKDGRPDLNCVRIPTGNVGATIRFQCPRAGSHVPRGGCFAPVRYDAGSAGHVRGGTRTSPPPTRSRSAGRRVYHDA